MTAGLTSLQGGEGAQRCWEEMDFRSAAVCAEKTKMEESKGAHK